MVKDSKVKDSNWITQRRTCMTNHKELMMNYNRRFKILWHQNLTKLMNIIYINNSQDTNK